MSKKYFIKTYGCQMNENDSEIIAGILELKGYAKAEKPENADIIITNTCSVRDSAERKAKGFIADLVNIKKKNKDILIGIVGCMAERMGQELLKKYKFADFVLGPNREKELIKILTPSRYASHPSPFHGEGKARSAGVRCATGDSPEFKDPLIAKREISTNAWITIMEGCNNFCSYCIVPYVRGREKSKSIESIVTEIKSLDKNVYKEIMLLGQNVNSYAFGLDKLLDEVTKIEGILRVRFMTSHPRDMSDRIIDAVSRNPKVCEYFHLPLQSGDNEILKKMNRGYTREYYTELVSRIREKIPQAAITSDAIAGFPGETDAQFQNTIDLISSMELDSVNTLAFNPRPGTAAEKMPGQISKDVTKKRLQALMETVERTSFKVNQRLAGTVQEVLIEDPGVGRTRTNKIVKFNKKTGKTGELINIRIKSAGSWVLQGEAVS